MSLLQSRVIGGLKNEESIVETGGCKKGQNIDEQTLEEEQDDKERHLGLGQRDHSTKEQTRRKRRKFCKDSCD